MINDQKLGRFFDPESETKEGNSIIFMKNDPFFIHAIHNSKKMLSRCAFMFFHENTLLEFENVRHCTTLVTFWVVGYPNFFVHQLMNFVVMFK